MQSCRKKCFRIACYAVILAGLSAANAWALPSARQQVMISSGTGFVVSSYGDIVTNNHVIEGCSTVTIQGPIPTDKAEVIAVDREFDLALLRTKAHVRRVAVIRHPGASHLIENEPVLVMGYPLDSFKTAEYKIAESRVVGLKGPMDEPQWIQFSDSAQHGNSGGPLLDSSGNVAGVIVGKSTVTRYVPERGRNELVSKSDVAISLPILLKFLDKNHVLYGTYGSYTYMMPQRVEEFAKAYIVNILCVQPTKN